MLLAGCNGATEDQKNHKKINSKENDSVNNIDIYDFYYINRAPEAKGRYDINEVIKFYFSTNSPISTSTAIDIKNNAIYKDPTSSTNGIIILEEPIEFNNKKALLNILEKYKVQEWKEDYTTQDPDSYQDGDSWKLLLQFEDGTVETYRGQGTIDDIFPKDFNRFVEEIDKLAKEILGEDYMNDVHWEP